MRIKSLTAAFAGLAMLVAPVAASANPAAPLAVSGSLGAASVQEETAEGSGIGGGGLVIGLVLVAMIAAALVLPDALDDGPNSP